jgi:biopolymer transport protein ExbD
MRLRRHFDTEESTGIDLAPMLDFVLNLLIFFIITAVFVKELSVQVQRHGGGASGPSSGKEAGSISVIVKQTGDVIVDGLPVDPRAVRANIERLHAQKPDWGVMVTAEQEADAGLLVQVVDGVREAGVMNVSFGTSSK